MIFFNFSPMVWRILCTIFFSVIIFFESLLSFGVLADNWNVLKLHEQLYVYGLEYRCLLILNLNIYMLNSLTVFYPCLNCFSFWAADFYSEYSSELFGRIVENNFQLWGFLFSKTIEMIFSSKILTSLRMVSSVYNLSFLPLLLIKIIKTTEIRHCF